MMRRAVIVLGMHRSGTSCLAGILESAGVNFGEVSKQNVFNLKGNRENLLIMELHDSLLRFNHGSWDSPPLAVTWPADLRQKRDRIIQEFANSQLWGFKDPRTLLMLEGWLEALQDVVLVGTFRHPLAVAGSLQERNGFTLEKCMNLWKTYNAKLLSYSDRYAFPLISFDLPATVYKEKVALILNRLGLKPRDESADFFEDSLRHPRITDAGLDPDISGLYDKLIRNSL